MTWLGEYDGRCPECRTQVNHMTGSDGAAVVVPSPPADANQHDLTDDSIKYPRGEVAFNPSEFASGGKRQCID